MTFLQRNLQRKLFGNSASFKIADALLTIIPLIIITYVLIKLFKQTFKKYALGNLILSSSFIIWGIVIWKVENMLLNLQKFQQHGLEF
jgi:POT family proton-dependent oligopeptide transporter